VWRALSRSAHPGGESDGPQPGRSDLWDGPAVAAEPVTVTAPTGRRSRRLALTGIAAGVAALAVAGGAFYAAAPLAGGDDSAVVGQASSLDSALDEAAAVDAAERPASPNGAPAQAADADFAPAPSSLPQLAEVGLAEVELAGPQARPRPVIEPVRVEVAVDEGDQNVAQETYTPEPDPLPQDDPRWRVARTIQAPANSEAAALSDMLTTKFRGGTSVSTGSTGSIDAINSLDRSGDTVREASSEAEILELEAQMSAENPQDFAALTTDVAPSDAGRSPAVVEAPVATIEAAAESAAALAPARASAYVNLRASASNDATILTVVPANAAIRAASDCEHFCEVVYNGQRGFVGKSFVRRGDAASRPAAPAAAQTAAPSVAAAPPETPADTATNTPSETTAETTAPAEQPANRPRPLLSRFMQQDESR
jgi:hypothetical protein